MQLAASGLILVLFHSLKKLFEETLDQNRLVDLLLFLLIRPVNMNKQHLKLILAPIVI